MKVRFCIGSHKVLATSAPRELQSTEAHGMPQVVISFWAEVQMLKNEFALIHEPLRSRAKGSKALL